MNREAVPPRSTTWKWWIVALLLLATMLNYMDRQTLASVAKRITDEFHLSQEQYGDIEFAFGWGFAAGSLVFGILADIINVRWLYPMVLLGWSAMGLMSGFTHGFMPMLACRALLGFFESGQWPCALRTTQAVLADGQRSLGNSVLQSGASLGAILTPIILRFMVAGNSAPGAWRPAFMVIGALGIVWIVAWLASSHSQDFSVGRTIEVKSQTTSEWWRQLGRDRRFWSLVVMVIAINIIWHITRAWLTKFLQQGRNYTESDALLISSAFYIATDVGCLLSGAAALWLTRRRLDAHRARLWVFGICSAITVLTSVLALLPKGYLLLGVLFLVGAAVLGLFPCYYSFTQEFGGRHVGKATGLLSTIGWLVASPLQKYFGKLVDQTHSFDLGISLIGWVPCIALVTMLVFWRTETKAGNH